MAPSETVAPDSRDDEPLSSRSLHRRVDLLTMITRCLLEGSPSHEEKIRRLVYHCRTLLEADCVAYQSLDGKNVCFDAQPAERLDLPFVVRMPGSLGYDVLHGRAKGDTTTHTEMDLQGTRYAVDDPLIKACQAASFMGHVTVGLDGSPLGILMAFYKNDAAPKDQRVLGIMATAIGNEANAQLAANSISIFQALFSSAHNPIIASAPDGKITLWNAAAERMLGWSGSEMIGQDAHQILDATGKAPPTKQAMAHYRQTAKHDQTGQTLKTMAKHKEGFGIPIEITLSTATVDGQTHFMAFLRDLREREKAANDLRSSEDRYATLANALPDAVTVVGEDDIIRSANRQAVIGLCGHPGGDLIGKVLSDFFPEDYSATHRRAIQSVIRTGRATRHEENASFAGVEKHFETRLMPVVENGATVAALCLTRDITDQKREEMERRALEEKLRQTQKGETIGRLAGGIAHDFNNLLTSIIGDLGVLRDMSSASPDNVMLIDEILGTAHRAADSTRALLTLSRQQVIKQREVSLVELVEGSYKILMRTLGEEVRIETGSNGPCRVCVDQGQMEHVLLNLAVNARDAMPDGGTLTITTEEIELDEKTAARLDLKPGPHVRLSVRDTGTGIDPEVRTKIFEPFFTTKPSGKGTGLGLAIVFGAVQQHNGAIEVETELGQGSVFSIYLPRAIHRHLPTNANPHASQQGGLGTILVVEDEKIVLKTAMRMLTMCGFKTLGANDPETALGILNDQSICIDLLFTDVRMPKMNGLELARKARVIRPTIPVLFTSGYTKEQGVLDSIDAKDLNFIAKPYTRDQLMLVLDIAFNSEPRPI